MAASKMDSVLIFSLVVICTYCLLQSDLADSYLEALDRTFNGVYKKKYPVVGYMKYLIDSQTKRSNEL